jgi:hypothetical protein
MFVDGSHDEKKALEAACDAAGETIDGIGITDLAQLNADQWEAIIRSTCHAYAKRLFLGYVDSLIPF